MKPLERNQCREGEFPIPDGFPLVVTGPDGATRSALCWIPAEVHKPNERNAIYGVRYHSTSNNGTDNWGIVDTWRKLAAASLA